ncbi:MAG: Ig-like domain-containing protein [Oscillospiraceae bacterium]|nr:Ig-like domain-containing protein [Oscillospiraceae bacterium]
MVKSNAQRPLSLILAILMLITSLPLTAFASGEADFAYNHFAHGLEYSHFSAYEPEYDFSDDGLEAEAVEPGEPSSSFIELAPMTGVSPMNIADRYIVVQEWNNRAVVNGTDIHMIHQTVALYETMFIPIASISALLGAYPVTFADEILSITMGTRRIELTIGSLIVGVWENNVRQPDQNLQDILPPAWTAHPVQRIDNIVYAPVRALSLALGAESVEWFAPGPDDVGSFAVISMRSITRDEAEAYLNISRPLLTPSYIGTTGIAVTPASMTLTIDRTHPTPSQRFQTGQFNASVQPANATNRTVTWTSSNPSVATVNATGLVTAVNAGTAIITVRTADNTHIPANTVTRTVTVVERAQTVTLNTPSTLHVQGTIRETFDFTATVQPAQAQNSSIFWSSTDTSVATVNQSGRVTAMGPGTTTIRALVEGSEGRVFADRAVTVVARASTLVLDRNSLTLHMAGGTGETVRLTATATPTTAINVGDIVWTTSNPAVATVDQSGNVTATGTGTATIRASIAGAGIFPELIAACVITVNNFATGIESDEDFITLIIEGDQFGAWTLTETIIPADATNRAVTWETDDPNIATVDQNGRVEAVNPGETIVRVRIDGTALYAECIVYVTVIPTGLTLDGSSWTLVANNPARRSVTLNATPDNPDVSGTFVWASDNPNIATVDEDGVVRAVGVGMTFVRVELQGTNLFAVARIRVVEEVTGIRLPLAESLEINGDFFESKPLVPTILPTTATEQRVTWGSSDESIVRVDQSGQITAVSPGRAYVTATTADGGFETHTQVTVEARVTHVLVDQSELILTIFGDQIGRAQLGVTVLPANAANRTVEFVGYDRSIIHVSANGLVTARDGGQTEIIIRARDNGIYSETRVTVIVRVVGLRLSQTAVTLTPANTAVRTAHQLRAIITPANVTDRAVQWVSNNTDVATVDETGFVSAGQPGTATITATLEGLSASATVTVMPEILIKPDFNDVFVNGHVMRNDFPSALYLDDTAMMSLRVLMDALGNQSLYSYHHGTARIYTDDGLVVNLQVGRPSMFVRPATTNLAREIPLPRSPRIVGERMYVPARAVMEALGWHVHWRETAVRGETYILLTRVSLSQGQVWEKINHAKAPDNLNILPITGIRIDPPIGGTVRDDGTIFIPEGETRTLRATVLPDVPNIESRWVRWQSSDPAVVSVNAQTGAVTGRSAGVAWITAENGRGHTERVRVQVASTVVMMPRLATRFNQGLVNNQIVDGVNDTSYVTTLVEGYTTMTAIGPLFRALPGGRVDWDSATQSATIIYDGIALRLTIGSLHYSVTDRAGHTTTRTFPTAPQTVHSRTYAPLRNVFEAFGFFVYYVGGFNGVRGESYVIATEYPRNTVAERNAIAQNARTRWGLVDASHVTVDPTHLTADQTGIMRQLTATVHPEYAASHEVDWSSSNPHAVTVDENGRIYMRMGAFI